MEPLDIRVAKECVPGYSWTKLVENGTEWHGSGMLWLAELQKKFNFNYSFVDKRTFPKYDESDGVNSMAKGTFYFNCLLQSKSKS